MKNEYKLMIFICLLSLLFMLISIFCLYDKSLSIYYVYQVGIYNEEENKDSKIKELNDEGIEGYCYKKDGKYYVLSMISQDLDDIKEHELLFDGIIKTYHLKNDLSHNEVLKNIEGS